MSHRAIEWVVFKVYGGDNESQEITKFQTKSRNNDGSENIQFPGSGGGNKEIRLLRNLLCNYLIVYGFI